MSRTTGMLNLSGNLEVKAGAPLDARTKVPLKSDLTASGTFPYFYEGLTVYVADEKKSYTLIGSDTTVLTNWKEVGSGGSEYTAGDGIDITNDEISLIPTESDDMDEIVSPLPSGAISMPIMIDESGAERVVGLYMYVNGTKKPIYQRSYVVTSDAYVSGGESLNAISLDGFTDNFVTDVTPSLDKLINAKLDVNYVSENNLGYISNITFALNPTNGKVSNWDNPYVNMVGFRIGAGAIITVQYTKTTDTPE